MEFQILVILTVAFLVFGPEKMLEFATQLGKLVRRIKQEWNNIKLELQMEELKRELKKQQEEGEKKVREYLRQEKPLKKETNQREILERQLSMEDLVNGNAPIVGDETKKDTKNP
jgi:Sec-independent protein translocase protein TatA